jgi:TPR repeat protein
MNPDVYIKKLFDEGNIEDGLDDAVESYLGLRGEPDLQKSFASFETAAAQGKKSAKYILSLMHVYGKGTVQSGEQSARWLKKAVKSGSMDAEFDLGFCYYIGNKIASEIIDSNDKKQGNETVITGQSRINKTPLIVGERSIVDSLSQLTYDTLLVHPLTIVSINEKQNKQKALHLFKQAGMRGHVVALEFIANMMYVDDSVGLDETESSIIYEITAMNGNPYVRYRLALMYYAGKAVKKDHKKAVDLLLPNAKSGYDVSQNLLGGIYYFGDDSVKNYEEAVKWYTISANAGNVLSMYQLSMCYLKGTGVEENDDLALKYLFMSAEKKYPEALYILGKMYYDGQFVELSRDKAVEYFQYAVDANYAPALHTLGRMYMEGDTVPKNRDIGLSLLHQSVKMGNMESLEWINNEDLH